MDIQIKVNALLCMAAHNADPGRDWDYVVDEFFAELTADERRAAGDMGRELLRESASAIAGVDEECAVSACAAFVIARDESGAGRAAARVRELDGNGYNSRNVGWLCAALARGKGGANDISP